MRANVALKKFLNEEGDKLTIDDIKLIKESIDWYSDEINDVYWRDHIINIVDLYRTVLKLKAESK